MSLRGWRGGRCRGCGGVGRVAGGCGSCGAEWRGLDLRVDGAWDWVGLRDKEVVAREAVRAEV